PRHTPFLIISRSNCAPRGAFHLLIPSEIAVSPLRSGRHGGLTDRTGTGDGHQPRTEDGKAGEGGAAFHDTRRRRGPLPLPAALAPGVGRPCPVWVRWWALAQTTGKH